MAATKENVTKQRIKRLLETSGAYFFMPPANGYGRAGIPDFVACVKGRFVAIEAKAGKGKTTALQDRELQRISDAGGVSLVVYDTEEDFNRLNTMLKALNAPQLNLK